MSDEFPAGATRAQRLRLLDQAERRIVAQGWKATQEPGEETAAAAFFDAVAQQCRRLNTGDPRFDGAVMLNRIRSRHYIRNFGFPVISADDIRWIRQETAAGPMFEVGAAPGYLAYECNRFGLKVKPSDPYPQGESGWDWLRPRRMLRCAGQQAVRVHRGKNLLWSWPEYRQDYVTETLRRFEGRYAVYIGEFGGCTGNDEFHELLERDYEATGERTPRRFPMIRDSIYVFRRR